MAYCRNTGPNSEVYLYISPNGFNFHIVSKTTGQLIWFVKKTHKEALKKLERLRRQGYKIPQYAFDRLKEEIDEKESKES